ncbi:hypothetical protein TKK_0003356 [Trichogramma kaykai]
MRYGSERILLCTAILLIAYSSAYFVGLFRAVNTIDDYFSPVDDLEDFIENDKLVVPTHTTVMPQIQQITPRKIVPINDVPPCLREIIFGRDDLICICGEILLKAHGIRDTETIHVSRPLVNMRTVVFAVRPDWFLLPKLNNFLLRIYETGIVKKQYEANYTIDWGAESDGATAGKRDFGLKIREMHLVFTVVLAGYALAIVVFGLELLNERTNNKIVTNDVVKITIVH